MSHSLSLDDVKEVDQIVRRALDDTSGHEDTATVDNLQRVLSTMRTAAALQRCLPSQWCVHLQLVAQRAWNASVTCRWTEERVGAKAAVREVATYAFLLSRHCFTPIREAFLRGHPRDGEKCVLMCCRTARDLVDAGRPDAAEDLLELANTIVTANDGNRCVNEPATVLGSDETATVEHVRPAKLSSSSTHPLSHLRCEVVYACMTVAWSARHFDKAVRHAETLRRLTWRHHPYREALLQRIFAIAESVIANETGRGGGAEATTALPYVQSLLEMSVAMQKDAWHGQEVCARKPRALLAVTLVQRASCLMCMGRYEEAGESAEDAYRTQPSLEPLVVQLRCAAQLHDTPRALHLFDRVLHAVPRTPPSVVDVFSLAFLLVDTVAEAAKDVTDMMRAFTTAVGDSGGTEAAQQLLLQTVCLLLRVGTDWSARELFTVLAEAPSATCSASPSFSSASLAAASPVPSTASLGHARFFLCALWGLSDKAGLSLEVRQLALDAALRFDHVASDEEVEGILLDLCRISFTAYEEAMRAGDAHCPPHHQHGGGGGGDVSILRLPHRLMTAHTARLRCAQAMVYQCELTYLCDGAEPAQEQLGRFFSHVTVSEVEPTMVTAAAASLIHFFVTMHKQLTLAGEVAEATLSLPETACALNAVQRRAFLKVCALATLHDDGPGHSDAEEAPSSLVVKEGNASRQVEVAMQARTAFSVPLERVPPSEALWWACFFFYAGSAVSVSVAVDGGLLTAAQLTCTGVNLLEHYGDLQDATVCDLLLDHLLLLFDVEMELFVSGADTVLTVTELQRCTALARDLAASHNRQQEKAISFFLVSAQVQLRGLVERAKQSPHGKACADDLDEAAVQGVVESCSLQRLADVQATVADMELLAAAFTTAADCCGALLLSQHAVTLLLGAATELWRGCMPTTRDTESTQDTSDDGRVFAASAVASFLVMCYRAYVSAPDLASRYATCHLLQRWLLASLSAGKTVRDLMLTTPAREHPAPDADSPPLGRDCVEYVETLMEFFAVEAWNHTVRRNACRDRDGAQQWGEIAEHAARALRPRSGARIAIESLLHRMPLL